MTKKEMMKEIRELNSKVHNLECDNRRLKDELIENKRQFSNLLEMIDIPTVISDNSAIVRWVDHKQGLTWQRFIRSLIINTCIYNYKAEIIHDSKDYFVFKISGYTDPYAKLDEILSLPDRIEYYRVDKYTAKSEKIDIKDYMEMVKKF